jgi:hypothetical protein
MMKRIAFFVIAACAFGAVPLVGRLGVVGGSLAFVALGVLLALAASGGVLALAIAGGATGAFAATLLGPVWAPLGGAVLMGFAMAERTARVRTRGARVTHGALAVVGGAVAAGISSSFVASSIPVRVVAAVVGAVVVALPLLIEADDPLAHALDAAALTVGEPSRAKLMEGAALRRTADDVLLDRPAMRQVRRTWKSLARLAEARARLERRRTPGIASSSDAVVAMVDDRIAQHVAALGRAFTAHDAARAAGVGLDDAALRNVESVGESLETLSEAIVETR